MQKLAHPRLEQDSRQNVCASASQLPLEVPAIDAPFASVSRPRHNCVVTLFLLPDEVRDVLWLRSSNESELGRSIWCLNQVITQQC